METVRNKLVVSQDIIDRFDMHASRASFRRGKAAARGASLPKAFHLCPWCAPGHGQGDRGAFKQPSFHASSGSVSSEILIAGKDTMGLTDDLRGGWDLPSLQIISIRRADTTSFAHVQ